MTRGLLTIVISAPLAVAGAAAAADMLVPVDGFDDYDDAGEFGSAWSVVFPQSADLSLSTGFGRTGQSMRIAGPGDTFLDAGVARYDLGVPADWTAYGSLELWYAGGPAAGEPSTSEGLRVVLRRADGQALATGPVVDGATLSASWTRYRMDLAGVPADAVRFLEVQVLEGDAGAGVLYVDDIALGARPLDIDASGVSHELLGFGAQIWPGDALGESVLSTMGFNWARIAVGPNWDSLDPPPPSEADFAEMYAYVSQNFNGDSPFRLSSAVGAFEFAETNGIDIVLNQFKIPDAWLSGGGYLRASNLDEYADFWGALVKLLDEQGVRPEYVELANEPNGLWNGRITPERYNTLVTLARQRLDALGFTGIGIVGPGLSEMQIGENWIGGLNADAVEGLAGWSTHTWDDAEGFEAVWPGFGDAIEQADPQGEKPIFITEYATARTEFNGVAYDTNAGDPASPASESSPFGVQVLENTIRLLNRGAGALIYWEAADQSWHDDRWGLRRLDGGWRPAADTLFMLASLAPPGSQVVEPVWHDEALQAAALLTPDETLVVAMTNMGVEDVGRVLTLESHEVTGVVKAWRFADDQVADITGSTAVGPDGGVGVGVPGEGCVVVELDVQTPGCTGADVAEPFGVLDLQDVSAFAAGFMALDPTSDLNGDGVFDLADITAFADSFLGGCG